MANYQKLCDDVIEAHEELTELTEQIALIDKTNAAALELVKEYYKAISNLATNLKTRIASKSAAARSAKAKAAAKEEYDDDGNMHHIELENGESIVFESQLLKIGTKKKATNDGD